jgi:hypothetical protein
VTTECATLNANAVTAQDPLTTADAWAPAGYPRRMDVAQDVERGSRELAERLRALLDQLRDPAPRSGPEAQRQFELCAEVEAILEARKAAREHRTSV